MGLFYTTFTTYGPDTKQIVRVLSDLHRAAFVSPTDGGFSVVYDRASEGQDFDEIGKLGRELSAAWESPILAAALHDDDVLYLWLFENGDQIDFYNSLPQYFDADAEPGPPEGGDASAICGAFDRRGNEVRVEELLRANLLEDELLEIVGELERHQAIISELGMPAYAAVVTYSSVEGAYVPEEFSKVEFVRVPAD